MKARSTNKAVRKEKAVTIVTEGTNEGGEMERNYPMEAQGRRTKREARSRVPERKQRAK